MTELACILIPLYLGLIGVGTIASLYMKRVIKKIKRKPASFQVWVQGP
jgi:hypothetical protein